MKTGLESLDTGAPEITYSGNQGPKSPQEDQQKMAEFQLQEYMEEFERVFPDMKDKRGTPDYMKELQDYFEGLASKQDEGIMMAGSLGDEKDDISKEMFGKPVKDLNAGELEELMEELERLREKFRASKQDEGIGNMAMKSGLIDEYRNYKMGQEEAGEQFMSPRDYYRSLEQDRMGAAFGGIMGLDGRRAYVGGSYSGSTSSSGKGSQGSGKGYQGGSGAAGSAESGKDVGSDDGPSYDSGTVSGDDYRRSAREFEVDVEGGKADVTKFKETVKYPDTKNPFKKFANFSNSKNRKFFENVIRAGKIPGLNFGTISDMSQEELEEAYDNYMSNRLSGSTDAYGNPTPNFGNDGPPIILPYPTTTGMTEGATDPEELGTEFTSQFTRNELTDAEKERISNIGGKSIFLADGGMARERAAFGGIMGDDGRRAYGLGSIFKKAARAIKKVVKSPIGMAALGYLGSNALMGKTGMSLFSNPFKNILSQNFMQKGKFARSLYDKLLMKKVGDKYSGNFDPFKIGILGASALTGLYAKQDQDDEQSLDEYLGSANRGPKMDPRGIREYIAMNKGNINPMDYAFLNPDYYAADGGRIGLMNGGIGDLRGALSKEMFNLGEDEDEEDEIKKLAMGGSAGMPPITLQLDGQNIKSFSDDESTGMANTTTMPNQMPRPMMDPMMQRQMMAQRGMMQQPRIMAQEGGIMDKGGGADMGSVNKKNVDRIRIAILKGVADGLFTFEDLIKYDQQGVLPLEEITKPIAEPFYPDRFKDLKPIAEPFYPDKFKDLKPELMSQGGRIMAQEGGMMDMGGMEKDYRNEGGFVPIGGQERADDVPARLSKNEFVFTADAVRNAGGGDIDKGAEIMENMMENLEAGGKVSKGSQGLSGAREMFATSQRLEEVL